MDGAVIERFDILGLHPCGGGFDGFDLVLYVDGDAFLYGVRTADLVNGGQANVPDGWLGRYHPLRVDFDPAAVRHWDFNQPMWIGPGLVWSNAQAFTRRGIEYLVGHARFGPLLADLPRLADLAQLQVP